MVVVVLYPGESLGRGCGLLLIGPPVHRALRGRRPVSCVELYADLRLYNRQLSPEQAAEEIVTWLGGSR